MIPSYLLISPVFWIFVKLRECSEFWISARLGYLGISAEFLISAEFTVVFWISYKFWRSLFEFAWLHILMRLMCAYRGSETLPSAAQLHELQHRFSDGVSVLCAVVMPSSVVFYSCSDVSLPGDVTPTVTSNWIPTGGVKSSVTLSPTAARISHKLHSEFSLLPQLRPLPTPLEDSA